MSSSLRKLPLWGVSLILVLALHLGLFLWALYWRPQAMPLQVPPAAMLIELEPLAAAPKPAPPPPPQLQPQEPEPQPKLVEAPKPKLAVAPPKSQPKPRPPKPVEPKPQVKPADNPPQDTPPAPVAAADAKPAAPQQAAVSAPSKAEISWQSKLLSHLSRYKRYPDDARRRGFEGVNRLRFVVDGRGKVLSYSLAGRSGSASLDRATLEMIRRAQPLPPPPAEMLQNGQLEIVAPFVYSLDRR
ncbi:TonB family protein [Pseudomonas sp. L-22-4S-12]|uniref:energy transducer TonB n=1 Tax=Pseudomonas sp. L-22-4S-12 TaxID=2610893 RepID=UPI00132425A4|nr:energy transducer TonB [Pseudomonas sp. L-22-4S-12]MWV14646.1 TonB family protein [Pseudomonas sp. L-22-4S-12]